MSLFSRKKTYVSAYTMSLVETTPDLTKSSVSTSILKSRDIAPDIVGNYLNGIYTKARNYYNYGRDYYDLGLPDGTKEIVQPNNIEMASILETIVGSPITLLTSTIDLCDVNFFAIPWLIANRGYNESTEIVTSHPALPPASAGATVYFEFATITADNTAELVYRYLDTSGDDAFVYETVTLTGLREDEYFYHVTYVLKNTSSPIYRWTYNVNSGVYPTLTVNPTIDLASPYFPVAILRQNNNSMDSGDQYYASTKKLLSKLDIDIDEVVEGINANPDIGEIDHAYIIMGVDISTDVEVSMEYLHDYFVYLHAQNPTAKSGYDAWDSNATNYPSYTNTPPMQKVKIKDAKYNVDIGYLFTEYNVVTGTLTNRVEREWTNRVPRTGEGYAVETSEIIFRKRLSPTTYSEIRVYGLMHVNHVYKGKTVDTTLAKAFYRDGDGDQTNGNFIIPLNNVVLKNLGLFKGNELMYDAIKIVFNSYKTVKLKWYQTGFFQFVTIIIAIAITILTYQPGALTSSLVGAGAVTGLTTLQLIMADVVVAFAIRQGFEMISDILPVEIQFALAIAMAAYAAGSYLGTGSLQGLPFASEALSAANGLYNSGLEKAFTELNIEIEDFEVEAEAKMDELDDLWEELEVGVNLDPMDIFTDFGKEQYFETPSAYLYRTVHAGNIGASTLDSINFYVDTQLSLPSLSNDLGVSINV